MQSALPLGFALLLAAGVVRFIREGFASTQQAVNSVFIPLAAAAMLFWCMSDYYAPRYTLLATTFTSLALGALIATRRQRGGTYTRLLEFLSIALYLSSMSFVLGAAVTAVKQRGDRNYATAAADIVREANLEGLVLTESAGWLALRPLTRRGQLHHLLPKVGDPSDLNSSTLLSDPGRGGDISTVVVLPGHIAAFRKLYPAVNAFMEQPDTVGPLEVDAASSTYHMQMYVRRRL
jgi:hypothetical protein